MFNITNDDIEGQFAAQNDGALQVEGDHDVMAFEDQGDRDNDHDEEDVVPFELQENRNNDNGEEMNNQRANAAPAPYNQDNLGPEIEESSEFAMISNMISNSEITSPQNSSSGLDGFIVIDKLKSSQIQKSAQEKYIDDNLEASCVKSDRDISLKYESEPNRVRSRSCDERFSSSKEFVTNYLSHKDQLSEEHASENSTLKNQTTESNPSNLLENNLSNSQDNSCNIRSSLSKFVKSKMLKSHDSVDNSIKLSKEIDFKEVDLKDIDKKSISASNIDLINILPILKSNTISDSHSPDQGSDKIKDIELDSKTSKKDIELSSEASKNKLTTHSKDLENDVLANSKNVKNEFSINSKELDKLNDLKKDNSIEDFKPNHILKSSEINILHADDKYKADVLHSNDQDNRLEPDINHATSDFDKSISNESDREADFLVSSAYNARFADLKQDKYDGHKQYNENINGNVDPITNNVKKVFQDKPMESLMPDLIKQTNVNKHKDASSDIESINENAPSATDIKQDKIDISLNTAQQPQKNDENTGTIRQYKASDKNLLENNSAFGGYILRSIINVPIISQDVISIVKNNLYHPDANNSIKDSKVLDSFIVKLDDVVSNNTDSYAAFSTQDTIKNMLNVIYHANNDVESKNFIHILNRGPLGEISSQASINTNTQAKQNNEILVAININPSPQFSLNRKDQNIEHNINLEKHISNITILPRIPEHQELKQKIEVITLNENNSKEISKFSWTGGNYIIQHPYETQLYYIIERKRRKMLSSYEDQHNQTNAKHLH